MVARLRGGLAPGGRRLLDRLLYEAIYSLPALNRLGCFNRGYHPPPADLLAVPGLEDTPLRAALCDFVLRAHPGMPAVPPRAVLDIGCGPGGGLLYAAAAFPGARLAGVDVSRRAIRQAGRRLRAHGVVAELVAAGGERLPFPDAAFDLVFSIETLALIGYAEFVAEAGRVLAPGGVISATAGVLDAPLLWTQARFAKLARENGLELRAFTDITEPCLAALEVQAPANEAVVARLPRPLRAYAREWAVLPGSTQHAAYLAGRKKEFALVLAKPG
jgi:SAM-dependent methyltransferase